MRAQWVLVACGTLAACGSEGSTSPPAPPEVTVRAQAPEEGTPAATANVAVGGAIEALGVSAEGGLVVAAAGRTYAMNDDAPELRALFAEPGAGDPESTGAIHTITAKNGGGAWIGAAEGLFELEPLYVTKVRVEVGAVLDAGEAMMGPLAGLWLATDGGLIQENGAKLESYAIPNLQGTPSNIAVDAEGTCALVLAGGQLALLEADGAGVTSDRPPLEAGMIHAVAGAHGTLYAASDRGVLRFDPSITPKWTRFTLSASSEGVAVSSIAVDPVSGAVWAATADALVRIDGANLTRYAIGSLAAGASGAIAVDRLGDVWRANGSSLDRVSATAMNAGVSFATDVKPWIEAHCAMCHSNQTANFEDYAVFKEKAELALSKVRAGDMPRCDGGVPCATADRLKPDDYAVLEQWIRAGKPE